MTQFGERLKKYRREKGMTQQELADTLGVSNKTVSRWESDGGYPDVTMLVPLARTLGVTVDDLLDGERPVRTLTRTDWQNLLSFGFALGGGVLFYLFDLFMPSVLCWLAYLGCMAYGVWLQKYYAYRTKVFFAANAVMNLAVNLSFAVTVVVGGLAGLVALFPGSNTITVERPMNPIFWLLVRRGALLAILCLLALLLTAATQVVIWRWSWGDEKLSFRVVWPLKLCRPTARKLLALLIPLAWVGFWVYYRPGVPAAVAQMQAYLYIGLTALSVLFCPVLFWRKGRRLMLLPSLALAGVCGLSINLARQMWFSTVSGRFFEAAHYYEPPEFIRFYSFNGEILILLSAVAAVYLLLCCVGLKKKEEKTEE